MTSRCWSGCGGGDFCSRVEFGELHMLVGVNFVITIRHAESPDLGRVRRRLEGNPELLSLGPEAVLYAALDRVVDQSPRWSPAWRTTSTRSRTNCSTGTQRCPGGSTNCPGRSSTASGPPTRCRTGWAALERGAEKYGVDVELRRNLRDVADHVWL
jgi:magnesium transporter